MSLSKSFGGVRALDGVDLTVPAGQVHALLGHNGAGKSTLIKCLGGAFPPDSGTIEVGGVPYGRLSPRESIAAGVAIIFQTLSVVDSLTVTENIFLGQEWTRYGRIDRRAQEKVAAELLDRVAASCSPRDRVSELPMGQRQLVEIAKALSRSASVLVLDEPTAALSGAESDALAARVEDLRSQGLAIVYVTHLLAEVERLADAVTVLRDGRVAHHSTGARQSRRELVDAITGGRGAGSPGSTGSGAATAPVSPVGERAAGVGGAAVAARGADDTDTGGRGAADHDVARHGELAPAGPDDRDGRPRRSGNDLDGRPRASGNDRPRRTAAAPDQAMALSAPTVSPTARLTVRGLRGPGFGPVDLTVGEGEIVGLYGLIGSGRTRVLETLFGRRRATGGTVRVGERVVAPARPADALGAGVALVPADRRAQGLFPMLTAQDNVLLPSVRTLARRGVRALGAERRVFGALAEAVGLRPARPGLPASAFSGGNQQKLLLGRWINEARQVDVLLLDEPTQGVDVGARQEIYDVVAGLAEQRGTAVLFASSDPEEAATLAHRCLVVDRGRIVGELSGPELTEEALLSAVHEAGTADTASDGADTAPTPADGDSNPLGSAPNPRGTAPKPPDTTPESPGGDPIPPGTAPKPPGGDPAVPHTPSHEGAA
ncbi:ATP-binding cassette domain-containing protein [Streptomyces ipomoeae]|uniref:sugar ABC transporter ATP-binding protein n=3 Tax=Streptomyces ipomoeae TaxID=103232 RepID=UPI0029A5AD1E|nr:ATP-binding cassette domain-containing protein [Streptomyces ipomoeae]MDX2827866.1 ATP-binding cassette domain-containing protein [Streptomyces ipomoeae]MDX2880418.1 ATP-binding cassette domain-containing protein [Streptomyces ipomoeae]